MTTHNPLPTTISCSWFWGPDPGVLDPYFKKMAAQGQSFFVASGDDATWSSTSAAWPAEDAWVTAVGGTDLVTDSRGEWASETTWVNSGGGPSPDNIAIPSWQQLPGVIDSSNMGSTIYRNGPDVAANANYSFYTCSQMHGCQANVWGGTSFAAPMWAAYVALVNQQLASQGLGPVGFLNPTLYGSNVKPGYSTKFHDITSGIAGSYSAETGYDLVTGWGSPKSGSLLFTYVPYTLFDPAEVALQEVEKAGLVPSFRGAGLKGSYVRTEAPSPGTIAIPGSTVTMVLVAGPTP
jgi:subtilase family serine protease